MFSLLAVVQIVSFSALLQSATASNVFDSLYEPPRGWTVARAAKGEESIKLRLSLKQQNVDTFYDKLMEVSTPDHPRYGMHYEHHEIRSLLKPSDESSNIAISWLQDNNITSIEDNSDYILFRTDVEPANKLLDTEFGWYHKVEENHAVLRTLAYSVPDKVQEHINFVQPTTRFGSLKPLSSTVQIIDTGAKSNGISQWWGDTSPKVNITCNQTITPECILDLYNVHYKGDAKNGNTVGYASFLEQYARYADLAQFEKVYAPYAIGENVNPSSFIPKPPPSSLIWFYFL
jgi:tripeptidyl-peptidase-1